MQNNIFNKEEEIQKLKDKIEYCKRKLNEGVSGIYEYSYRTNIAQCEKDIELLSDDSLSSAEIYLKRFGGE